MNESLVSFKSVLEIILSMHNDTEPILFSL